ncbi:MAG: hypothetical protein Q4F67_09270 [Propionibacteriaceae bacterium]|nr:hypothetical protein [Propionibacteriaceae bacterium]
MTQLTSLRLGATAVLVPLALLAACTTPPSVLASRCSGGTLQGYDCTVTVESFDAPTSGSLKAADRARNVTIEGTITVRSGSVEVSIGDGSANPDGAYTVTVTPDSPQEVSATVRTSRRISEDETLILVKATPLEPSEGLTMTLHYDD